MPGLQNSDEQADIDLGRLFASLGRHWLRILFGALVFAGAAYWFVTTATPLYRAETRLLIEARESVFTRPDRTGDAERPLLDEEGVTSQVEVIASADALARVAEKLNLAAEPEFSGRTGKVKQFLIRVGLVNDPSAMPEGERILQRLRDNLSVYRIDKSRVIVIEYSAENPRLAAAIPNALADEFLAAGQKVKRDTNTDATGWLAPEIEDLTRKVREAEAKVAEYRAKSGLVVGQNDTALTTQQLSELSSELSRVRANRATAEANAESMRNALESGASLDTLPEIVASPLIQSLRQRLAETQAQIADLSITLLPNHPRLRALNAQLANTQRQVRAEAENVLKGLDAAVETERAREQQLVADLDRLKDESGKAAEQEVDLRALEREAAAQRELLQSYLTRYREASSRQDSNYAPADARIFSRANTPSQPYYPKKLPIIGASFGAGLLFMSILTLLAELFSGRAVVQARQEAPVAKPDIIEAPLFVPDDAPLRITVPDEAVAVEPVPQEAEPAESQTAVADEPEVVPEIEADEGIPVADSEPAAKPRELGIVDAARQIVESGAGRAVFISPEGDDAAASSVLVARELADVGARVVLADLTADGVVTGPMLDGRELPGMTDLLGGKARFGEAIHADLYSDAHIVPAGTASAFDAMEGIGRLPAILDALNSAYTIVIIECGAVKAKALQHLSEGPFSLLVSYIDRNDPTVARALDDIADENLSIAALVTPAGHINVPQPSGAGERTDQAAPRTR